MSRQRLEEILAFDLGDAVDVPPASKEAQEAYEAKLDDYERARNEAEALLPFLYAGGA